MKNLLFLWTLLLCSSVFAQNINKEYIQINPELGGDVKIKSACIEVIGEKIQKTFELESSEDGFYYLDAWINIPMIGERFVEYKISINGVVSDFSFKPETLGWQSLALKNAERIIQISIGEKTISYKIKI